MTVEATMHRQVRTRSVEMYQLGILPLTFTSVTLLEQTRWQSKMTLPQLNQKHHATPTHQPLLVAFTPPENPCTQCKNIELFKLLSMLQGEDGQGMHIMAFEPNSYLICIDMGASASLSNDASHFISLNHVQQMANNGMGSELY